METTHVEGNFDFVATDNLDFKLDYSPPLTHNGMRL